jgi:hypothetical protein
VTGLGDPLIWNLGVGDLVAVYTRRGKVYTVTLFEVTDENGPDKLKKIEEFQFNPIDEGLD